MRFSDKLFSETKELWDIAAEKEFVTKMATGSLYGDLFRNYMLQDYLYLKDYIAILKKMHDLADDVSLKEFLKKAITGTEDETYHVHVPAMRKLGITDTEISQSNKDQIIEDYMSYMNHELDKNGLLAGLTALLQCSWAYAYIAETVSDRYKDELINSPYKFWFEAYTSDDYTQTNQLWIDIVDRETLDADDDKKETLRHIFKTCAEFENKFWDNLNEIQ